MTPAQLTTLKAFITTTYPGIPLTTDGDYAIADLLNATATPAYTLWNSNVDPQAIIQNGMVWADFKNLSPGQISIWSVMTSKGFINAAKTNERNGLVNALGNNANSASNIAAQPHLKKLASVFEKLFATGLGTDVAPSTSAISVGGVDGSVSYQEVGIARRS